MLVIVSSELSTGEAICSCGNSLFEQCIARPETDGKEFPPTDHFEAVVGRWGIIL